MEETEETLMWFSRRLSLSVLIDLCRALRHYLGAGLHLPDVFRQQALRGPMVFRPAADRIAAELAQGNDLSQALQKEAGLFPPLLLSLVGVGEHTGMLPEVFAELEKFFIRQQQLRRKFIAQITWPVIQFGLAILALTALIFILGMLPQNPGQPPYDPLGLGLSGPRGALIFLTGVVGILAALFGGFWLSKRAVKDSAVFDRFFLRLPGLGPCLRALALGRFSLALRLTHETGMDILEALKLSLRATGNLAFTVAEPKVRASIRGGSDLTQALERCGLFPEDYLHVIAVAEESGRLSEVLQHQALHYDEEAGRRLTVLTGMLGSSVWILVALVIIIAIFRLVSSYLGLLNSYMPP
jgi:type IV pilus assembly protein PilC